MFEYVNAAPTVNIVDIAAGNGHFLPVSFEWNERKKLIRNRKRMKIKQVPTWVTGSRY